MILGNFKNFVTIINKYLVFNKHLTTWIWHYRPFAMNFQTGFFKIFSFLERVWFTNLPGGGRGGITGIQASSIFKPTTLHCLIKSDQHNTSSGHNFVVRLALAVGTRILEWLCRIKFPGSDILGRGNYIFKIRYLRVQDKFHFNDCW